MKGLKIFGFGCFGLAAFCLLVAFLHGDWTEPVWWQITAVMSILSGALAFLVCRALKEFRAELELKMLMNG